MEPIVYSLAQPLPNTSVLSNRTKPIPGPPTAHSKRCCPFLCFYSLHFIRDFEMCPFACLSFVAFRVCSSTLETALFCLQYRFIIHCGCEYLYDNSKIYMITSFSKILEYTQQQQQQRQQQNIRDRQFNSTAQFIKVTRKVNQESTRYSEYCTGLGTRKWW